MSEGASADGAKLVAAAMNLAVDAAASEVVDALRIAGVGCVTLKGPPLAEWLYGPESDRFSVDVDLLVDPGRTAAAESALRRLGYEPIVPRARPTDRFHYASVWSRDSESPNVDLHTSIAGIGVSPESTWRVLSARTQDVVAGRTRIEVFDPGAQALHLALHAAKHGVGYTRPLHDLERAVEHLAPDVWRDAATLAAELEAVPAFTTGLALTPSGESLLERIGVARAASVDSALRAQTPPALALGVAHLAELPTLRAKASFVAGKVVPPPAYMRRWHPLARRGRLGLAAAYLYRPLWFALRVGPAVSAWQRAKRQSSTRP